MAKSKTIYVCESCGAKEPKWVGKCSTCGSWNTYKEEIEFKENKKVGNIFVGKNVSPLKLEQVKIGEDIRLDTGDGELNRVLGGGIVPGSMILLGGEPGIGKSTLVLQFSINSSISPILYMSGEESISQIKMRSIRLGGENNNALFVAGSSLEQLIECTKQVKPKVLIVDSIQTMASEFVEAIPGSITQIRECTYRLLKEAKENSMSVIIIGHITKDGNLAGPKILEHIVDTVLHFEGDSQHMYRVVRAVKNRFGSTSEIGIYEMSDVGLREVANPSELLLSNKEEEMSGIAVSAIVEGLRPMLLEVQALVSTAAYGTPQRSATGFDTRRLNMLLAVLEKRVGFKLGSKDVFLNIAGGLKIVDTALDLSVIMAVLSSNTDIAIPYDTVFIGEVGLSGEVRAVSRINQRVAEAIKLGFKNIVVAQSCKKSIPKTKDETNIIFVSKITDVVKYVFGKK